MTITPVVHVEPVRSPSQSGFGAAERGRAHPSTHLFHLMRC